MRRLRNRALDYTIDRTTYLTGVEQQKPGRRLLFPIEAAGVVVLAFLLVFFFGLQVTVSDYSMGESMHTGQKVLLNRLSYHFSDPKADDIVLYDMEGTGWKHNTIKRIVAVPGDTVQITDGYLYVNDVRYEPYAETWIEMSGIASEALTLSTDEYFVMGDDPQVSEDSRYPSIGPVKRDAIHGKVWLRLRPLSAFGRVG